MSTATEVPDRATLVSAMKGQLSTRGWDVMVSYASKQLNEVLKTLWMKSSNFSEVKIDTEFTIMEVMMRYTLTFGSPTLEFPPSDGAIALLKIPLSGYFERFDFESDERETGGSLVLSKVSKKKVVLPNGAFEVWITVPLVSVSGEVKTLDAYGPVQPAHTVAFIGAQAGATSNIVFHFGNETGTKFSVKDMRPEGSFVRGSIETTLQEARGSIQNWFQKSENVNSIDYVVARVKNTGGASAGDTVLQPKSFVFNTHGQGENAALSIYIQTEGSGNEPGIAHPSFQLEDKVTNKIVIHPIPQGSTASIIIRRDLFLQKYLVSGLTQALKSPQVPDPVEVLAVEDGFKLKLKLNRSFQGGGSQYQGFFSNYSSGDIKFNMSEHPIELNIRDLKAIWHWDVNFETTWSSSQQSLGGSEGGSNNQWGKNRTYITVNKEAAITKVTEKSINMNLDLRGDDFALRHEGLDMDFWDSISGGRKDIPTTLKNLKISFDPILIDLKGLNFFATQNVFAPDKHIIDIDNDAGILTPYDVILLGDVIPPK